MQPRVQCRHLEVDTSRIDSGHAHALAFAFLPPKISARCVMDTGLTLSHTAWPAIALATLGGSISAEHGVGSLKADKLPRYKSAVALDLMGERALERRAFGKRLADQSNLRDWIAESRVEIDQARLLCHKAAWTIDQHGNKAAHGLVSQIKAVAPLMACNVIDRAIQTHGAAGVSDDTVLARMYGWQRAMRIFDGPDEVHLRTIARTELGHEKSPLAAAVVPQ